MSTSTVLEHQTAPLLRKRTKALQLPSESEGPSSQLPSPLSSVDDNEVPDVHDVDFKPAFASPPPNTRRRRSSASIQGSRRTKVETLSPAEKATDSQWSDIPLAVALIPPLGSFLTGGDFLRDFLLFILLFFYLHQLIKLPWDLYLASRPRRRRITRTDVASEESRLHDLAASELRTAEFCYLALAVFAPLLGAALLRYVGTVLTGRDYISWFSTGIFVLVTGVRPWRHLGQRLRGRTEELQATVHSTIRTDDLQERIKKLETELAEVREAAATRDDVAALDEALDQLDAAIGRHSRMAEGGRRSMEEKFKTLEQSVESVRTAPSTWTMATPRLLLDWMRPQRMNFSRTQLLGTPRSPRAGYRPRLAPVHEEDSDGVSLRSRRRMRPKDYPPVDVWVELALSPLRVGRRLVWLIVDFLKRRLV